MSNQENLGQPSQGEPEYPGDLLSSESDESYREFIAGVRLVEWTADEAAETAENQRSSYAQQELYDELIQVFGSVDGLDISLVREYFAFRRTMIAVLDAAGRDIPPAADILALFEEYLNDD